MNRVNAVTDDPFRRMVREMEETLERFRTENKAFGGSMRSAVPVDVEEDGNQIVVRADLPGVEKDRIQISADRDTLVIRAADTRAVREENEQYLRQERSKREFRRRLQLPVPVDPGSAEAAYENGVLTVRMEKADGGARQDIDIT